jgi:hypothetical protein
MKNISFPYVAVCLCIVTALLASCSSPGFYPLYDAETVVKIPGLEGKWRSDEPKTTFKFQSDDAGYRLTYDEHSRGSEAEFLARAVRINNQYYVDITPAFEQLSLKDGPLKKPMIKNSLLLRTLMPVHLYARMKLDGNKLTINYIDFPKNDTLPATHPDYLPYDLLIASTQTMQKYIAAHPEVVSEERNNQIILTRK